MDGWMEGTRIYQGNLWESTPKSTQELSWINHNLQLEWMRIHGTNEWDWNYRMKNYEEGSRFIFGWTFPPKKNATMDPSGPRCPSPLLGRTPWAQRRQPRSSQTRSPHQGWARRPCRAWPCGVSTRETRTSAGHSRTQPIRNLELNDLTS